MTAFWGQARWRRWLGLFALGALAALGQAPTDLWFLTIAMFAVAMWLWRFTQTRRQSSGLWFWVGAGYFAVALRWIIEPFLVDIATHGWMAPFAIALMACGGGLFWAFAGWLAGQRGLLTLVAALTLTEALRSLILTGFPWALVGHIWIGTPISQLAAFAGPHGLSFVTLGLAACLAMLCERRWIFGLGPALAAVGWIALMPAPSETPNDRPLVRIVHPDIPQDEKWEPSLRLRNFEDMIALSQGDEVADMIVWPESAITQLLGSATLSFETMTDVAEGAAFVTGVQRRAGDLIYHNSFAVLGEDAQVDGVYDKQHLVPFGEYIPGGSLLNGLGLESFAQQLPLGFTSGSGRRLVNVEGIGLVRPLICYEGIFAEEVRNTAERPVAMVMVTNDAWFGTGAGPIQHLEQAQLRSIELGLPMVRSANSGISAMIDGKGRIIDQLGLGTAGAVEARLPPPLPPTVYARFGDLPTLVVVFLMALYGTVRSRKFPIDQGQTAP